MEQEYHGENLIFIISQPRSGSTLLQRILAGSPEVQTAAETWLMLHPVYGLKQTGVEAEYGSDWAAQAVDEFLVNYTSGREIYDVGIRAFAREVYGDALQRSGKHFFLDKTPRYFFIIPDLARIFPRAKFIILLRNPMGVLHSELNTYVKGRWPTLALFAPDLLVGPVRIAEGIKLLGEKAHVVRYEELVRDPETIIEGLCGSLGVDYCDEMIHYGDTPAPIGVMNDPVGIHQYSRPTDASVGKWKQLAGSAQTRHFAECYLETLGPDLLEELGYSYREIASVLSRGSQKSRGTGPIFPWALAIKPDSEWSAPDRFKSRRYFAMVEKGRVRGSLAEVWRTIGRLIARGYRSYR